MQVSVESGEGLEKHLRVDLPAERVTAAIEKKLQEISRTVRMDGFRPGKVPMRVVKQRFGNQVRQEAYGDLIQSTFYEAASKENLHPAGEPSIQLHDDQENGQFSYTATFEVMPEIKLAPMEDVTVKRPVASVTDGDVEEMIDRLRKQRTTWNEVEREAQDGDNLQIDFKGYIDGELFDGGSADNVPLVLGSGSMIEGFESGLVGAKSGESRTLDISFPEDYRAEKLAGKAARFEVAVNKVAEPQLPELDEAFIKTFGVEAGTEDALRAEIRSNMERELKQKLRSVTKERVMDALLEANEIVVPKAMVTEEAERMKQQAVQDMARSGHKSNMDLPASIFESQAKRRVELGLLIGDIIRQQQLQVDQERVRTMVEEFASTYENPQEVIDWYMNDRQQLSGIENLVLEEQVVDWLLEQTKIEEEQQSFNDLMNQGRTA